MSDNLSLSNLGGIQTVNEIVEFLEMGVQRALNPGVAMKALAPAKGGGRFDSGVVRTDGSPVMRGGVARRSGAEQALPSGRRGCVSGDGAIGGTMRGGENGDDVIIVMTLVEGSVGPDGELRDAGAKGGVGVVERETRGIWTWGERGREFC